MNDMDEIRWYAEGLAVPLRAGKAGGNNRQEQARYAPQTPRATPRKNGRWWLGLVAAVSMALTGQADLLPHPWHHWLSVLGIASTAASGYMLERRR